MMAQHQYGCPARMPGAGTASSPHANPLGGDHRVNKRDLRGYVVRRRVALIFSPAATTAAACNLPGERVSRSIGPDTDTAAMTFPPWPRTGADTDATPGSRSATLAAQPRRRTWASAV